MSTKETYTHKQKRQRVKKFLCFIYISLSLNPQFPSGLVVRISRSHRDGRGSIPRLGRFFFLHFSFCASSFFPYFYSIYSQHFLPHKNRKRGRQECRETRGDKAERDMEGVVKGADQSRVSSLPLICSTIHKATE